jgi:integrase/recombinase XerD
MLRHTVASRLITAAQASVGLPTCWRLKTTAIYAKLDLATLSRVSMPWIGGAQCAMTCQPELARHVDAYVAIREAVGLANTRHERGQRDFIAYARSVGAADGSPIRAATAVAWAWDQAPATCGIRGRGDRLIVVRGFLNYLAAIIPGTEVPGSRVIAAGRRRRPYVFSDEGMTTLIGAASRPNPRVPFRPIVLSTLLGLLASTGSRVAEACRLSLDDVRLGDAHAHLQILQTKLHKSRIVPIHPTVVAALPSARRPRSWTLVRESLPEP